MQYNWYKRGSVKFQSEHETNVYMQRTTTTHSPTTVVKTESSLSLETSNNSPRIKETGELISKC